MPRRRKDVQCEEATDDVQREPGKRILRNRQADKGASVGSGSASGKEEPVGNEKDIIDIPAVEANVKALRRSGSRNRPSRNTRENEIHSSVAVESVAIKPSKGKTRARVKGKIKTDLEIGQVFCKPQCESQIEGEGRLQCAVEERDSEQLHRDKHRHQNGEMSEQVKAKGSKSGKKHAVKNKGAVQVVSGYFSESLTNSDIRENRDTKYFETESEERNSSRAGKSLSSKLGFAKANLSLTQKLSKTAGETMGDDAFEDVQPKQMSKIQRKRKGVSSREGNVKKNRREDEMVKTMVDGASTKTSNPCDTLLSATTNVDLKTQKTPMDTKKKSEKSNTSAVAVIADHRKSGAKGKGRPKIDKQTKDTSRKLNSESVDKSQASSSLTGTLSVNETASGLLPKAVDHSDVTAVLLQMEGSTQPSTSRAGVMGDDSDESSGPEMMDCSDDEGDEEEDWEDVEDHHAKSPVKSQVPSTAVEITLEAPELGRKRKKREFDWHAYVRRKINRFKKELSIDIHKVHLLCLMSRGMFLNRLCQDEMLQAQAFSIAMATREITLPSMKSCGLAQLSALLKWFLDTFTVQSDEKRKANNNLREGLGEALTERFCKSSLHQALVFVILLRSLGFLTRLVMSLQPLPFKPAASKVDPSKPKRQKVTKKQEKPKPSPKQAGKIKSEKMRTGNRKDHRKLPGSQVGRSRETTSSKLVTKNSRRRSCASKVTPNSYKEDSGDDVDLNDDSGDDFVPVDEDVSSSGTDIAIKREENADSGHSSGSDFEEEEVVYRSPPLRRTSLGKKNRKILSSDSESVRSSPGIPLDGVNDWAEVFLETEKKWICINCCTGVLDKPYDLAKASTQPVHYTLAFSPDGSVKDVTARYASEWLTDTRKSRTDEDWWQETLSGYKTSNITQDEMEDRQLQGHLEQRPMPTSIGDFKNHPLYALKRHLLKFEAIYPDTAVPLGYVRGEPVYARECVQTLHSRENWLKEGRAVRLGEEPYKYVKSRPKWKKPKENPDALDLGIFGVWQTEVYIPPPAVDGKVPRNAHGNVELFLPSMLPAGTVHIKIQGLNKVAKKLDIDCAPAMIGWDHHCGFSHPQMDGWIVCEEFKDILLAAWDEEQEIIKEREKEKREKRAYGNWKLLIKGMLIKERLKKRFALEEAEKPETSTCKEETEKASDYQMSWPQNRQTGKHHKKGHFIVEKL